MAWSKPLVLMVVAAGAIGAAAWTWAGEEKKVKDVEGKPAATASAADIDNLITQLDAAEYSDREAATQKLTALGKEALPALAKSAAGENLEVASRSIALLAKLLASDDESTRSSARAALDAVAKGDNESAARRASTALKADEAKHQKPGMAFGGGPFQGQIIINGGGGGLQIGGPIQLQAVPLQVGGNVVARSISVSNNNGVREINASEDGKHVKIVDDPQNGIKVEVRHKKDGKEVTDKYEAKDADELKKKHPEGYKAYEQFGGDKNGNALGNIQIQVQANGLPIAPGAVPVLPIQPNAFPMPPNVVPAPQAAPGLALGNTHPLATSQAVHVKSLMGTLGRMSESLSKNPGFKDLPQSTKDDLKKKSQELQKQLVEMEKALEK